jgi:hypothetical protein
MTPPAETDGEQRRPAWLWPIVAVVVGAMAAISVAIYLGLVARGNAWPLYVLAVASAPLALLAVVQGVQAVVGLGRRDRSRRFNAE